MAIGYHLVFKVGFKVVKNLFCVLLKITSQCNKSPTSTRPHNFFLIFSSFMFGTIHDVISIPLCLCMQRSLWCGFLLLCTVVHVTNKVLLFVSLCLHMWHWLKCCFLFLCAYACDACWSWCCCLLLHASYKHIHLGATTFLFYVYVCGVGHGVIFPLYLFIFGILNLCHCHIHIMHLGVKSEFWMCRCL